MAGMPPLMVLAIAFVPSALGLPRFFVSFMLKRRLKKFMEELPNALDVMVRSIKSGLPLNDALRLIAAEAREPVKSEFPQGGRIPADGLGVPEAIGRMYDQRAAVGSEFLRHRHPDPGPGRRQSVGSPGNLSASFATARR